MKLYFINDKRKIIIENISPQAKERKNFKKVGLNFDEVWEYQQDGYKLVDWKQKGRLFYYGIIKYY